MRKPYLIFGIISTLAVLVGATLIFSQPEAAEPSITVYKSPTCGCCKHWVTHMEQNGFTAKVVDMPDVSPMKTKLGVSMALASCHTAVIDGYVIEGHVPADLIKKMLKERPKIAGLAVPGMVTGSPGMEVPGRPAEPYDVIAFTKDGKTSIYASR